MFVGHFGVGLAAKRIAPRTSLGWLITAPLLLDLLWPIFLLLGWETVLVEPGATVVTPFVFVSYPISHSLVAAVGLGGAFAGLLYWTMSRNAHGAFVISAGVVSHWFLDWVVHAPDLALYPGGAKYGLGLWTRWRLLLRLKPWLLAAGCGCMLGQRERRLAAGDWVGGLSLSSLLLSTRQIYWDLRRRGLRKWRL